MLQVYIEHFDNGTIVMQSICDDKTILSEFGENEIDLDVCIPYINQRIKVHHRYPENFKNSYTLTAILESVEVDSRTNVKCIKYSPIS